MLVKTAAVYLFRVDISRTIALKNLQPKKSHASNWDCSLSQLTKTNSTSSPPALALIALNVSMRRGVNARHGGHLLNKKLKKDQNKKSHVNINDYTAVWHVLINSYNSKYWFLTDRTCVSFRVNFDSRNKTKPTAVVWTYLLYTSVNYQNRFCAA